MTAPDFKYYLRYFDGAVYQYYYIDPSGNVDITTAMEPITYAPDGWKDTSLSWERAFTYWALFRKFTVPMGFVIDGAKILRHVFANQSVQGKCELYIEKLDRASLTYGLYYNGELDFSRANGALDHFKCEVTEGGFVEKLLARESTPYEYDIEQNPDVIWVKLHSCNLQYLAKWVGVMSEDVNTFPTMIFYNSEGVNQWLTIGEQDPTGIPVVGSAIKNMSGATKTFTLSYDYYYNIFIPSGTTAGGPYKFHLFYQIVNATTNVNISSSDILLYSGTQASGTSQTYLGSDTQTISLGTNQMIYVMIEMQTTTGPSGTINDASYSCTQLGSTMRLSMDTDTPETYFPCLRPKKVFDNLIDSIQEGTSTTKNSRLLSGDHVDKVITSGDAIRNLPLSKMKISFGDFFASVDSIFTAYLDYRKATDTVNLEYLEGAFDSSTVVLDLGEVADLTWEPFTSEMFSNLKIGFSDVTFDEVNGKDEFNIEANYLSPITRVKNSKEFKSPINAAMYSIILTALNLSGKEITDADTDNELFWLHIESSPAGTVPDGYTGVGQDYYNVYRKPIDLTSPGTNANYWKVENIYSPDKAFNFFFSPKNSLLRRGKYFHSLMYGLDAEYVKFQTSSKSNYTATKMKTTEGVALTVVDEGADELIGNLRNPIFQPYLFKFKCFTNSNINAIIEATPFSLVQFTWRGETYTGYFIRPAQKPAFQSGEEFTLLSSPLNDLTKLIY